MKKQATKRTRITVTIPRKLLEHIDKRRGMIPRSRFVSALLQNDIENEEWKELDSFR